MRGLIGWGVAGGLVALAMLAGGYQLGRSASAGVETVAVETPAPALDRTQVEGIVRDYLVKNPEIVVEMQAALEAKETEQKRVAALGAIKSSADDIYRSSADAVIGNPNGKTTIVEFYDYNCGFCKRALPDMQALTAADPDLRFVLKEFPILGPDSQRAHIVSQAFHRLMPAKYTEFHVALLGSEGRATEDTAIQLAVSLGADEAALRAEMAKPEIMATFQKSFELAEKLAITGTPSYVIGDEVVFGAMGEQVLTEKIAAARAQCQTAAC